MPKAIRLPEPPHGWRGLFWEVAVVVVGVLLALGAQQVADTLYWRSQAANAKQNIEAELLEHERDGYERRAVLPCLKNQLVLLSKRLSANPTRWIAVPMTVYPSSDIPTLAEKVTPTAYRAPTRLWIDEAFKTAQSSGALNHLPDRLVAEYSGIYRRSRRSIEIQDIEEEAANRLSALAVDGEITPESRIALLGALARADYASSYMETSLITKLAMLDKVLKDLPIEQRQRNVDEAIALQRKFRGACVRPLKLPN